MLIARIIGWSSVLPLAVGGCAVFYCIEKMRHAAGSTTSVGDDVIVIGYIATVLATSLSCLAAFIVRRQAAVFRVLPVTALVVCCAALVFWTWLHLSGVVVPYSKLAK